MHFISFEDNRLAQEKTVDELAKLYTHGQINRQHIAPSDYGLEAIGHFGFFRSKSESTLWQASLDWLQLEGVHAEAIL